MVQKEKKGTGSELWKHMAHWESVMDNDNIKLKCVCVCVCVSW